MLTKLNHLKRKVENKLTLAQEKGSVMAVGTETIENLLKMTIALSSLKTN